MLDALAAGAHAVASQEQGTRSDQANASAHGVEVRRLDWYPHGAAWQIDCSRRQMRSTSLRELQSLLVREAEDGKISRQEAVSMIPPLLLAVKPGHTVLDLCAAPGSKTGQLLELTATEGQPSLHKHVARDGAVRINQVFSSLPVVFTFHAFHPKIIY